MYFLKIKILLLLCCIPVGCSFSGNRVPTTPTVERSNEVAKPSQIADTSMPPSGQTQKSCGDTLPKDKQAYPVRFYPIFISYSDKNLKLAKKYFCEDAIEFI